jgi:hypothetical protein
MSGTAAITVVVAIVVAIHAIGVFLKDQDIGQFQVSVDIARLMHIAHPSGYIQRNLPHRTVVQRDALITNQIGQVAFQVFEKDGWRIAAESQHFDNGLVLHKGKELHFAPEILQLSGMEIILAMESLHGCQFVHFRTFRQANDKHTARASLAQDFDGSRDLFELE